MGLQREAVAEWRVERGNGTLELGGFATGELYAGITIGKSNFIYTKNTEILTR